MSCPLVGRGYPCRWGGGLERSLRPQSRGMGWGAQSRDGASSNPPCWGVSPPSFCSSASFCLLPPPPILLLFSLRDQRALCGTGNVSAFPQHCWGGGVGWWGGGARRAVFPGDPRTSATPPPGVGTRGGRGSELRGLGGIGGQRPQCGSVGPLPPSAARSRCGDIPPGLRGKNCPPKRDPIAAEPHSSFCPLILKPRRKSPSAFSFFSL